MARLFRKKAGKRKGLWQRVVDFANTDVRVAVTGVDQSGLERLEEQLIAADFGVDASLALVDRVEELNRTGRVRSDGLARALGGGIREILNEVAQPELRSAPEGPTVYLFVGVNGVGKTTTVAKVAQRVRAEGRSVLLAAADTFRAGAVEQLRVWAERVGAEFVGGQDAGDPAAVAYDAIDAAERRGIDVVLVDTAGRLHTHRHLMAELEKVHRVIAKRLPGAPHETLIVLDATVGQNALRQVEAFQAVTELSGIVLAKMDSSGKGGVVVALAKEYGLPVKLIGTGESLDDLAEFDPVDFVQSVVGG